MLAFEIIPDSLVSNKAISELEDCLLQVKLFGMVSTPQ